MSRSGASDKKIVIGLTGSFGSGKSTVAKIFGQLGAEVIDADKIAHKVIQPKQPFYQKIVSVFGKGILKKNLKINRAKLAKKVFRNKVLLKKLNRIVHPQVIKLIKNKIKKSSRKIIVLDAPLLIEVNLVHSVDKIIVVKINRKNQVERIIKRTSLNRQDILKRIAAQIPLSDKVRLADFVIDNSGTVSQTRKQIEVILGKMNISPRINCP